MVNVAVRWGASDSVDVIKYRIKVTVNGSYVMPIEKTIDNRLVLTRNEGVDLKIGDTLKVDVMAVNRDGLTSEPLSGEFEVVGTPPNPPTGLTFELA